MLQTAKHTRRHTHTHTCLSSTHTLTHKTSQNSSIEFCSAFSAPPPFNRYAPFKQSCSRLPPPLCSPQRVQRQQPTACSVCLLKCPLCVLSQTSENTNSNANKPDVRISWRPSSTFGIVLQSNLVGCSCADGLCSCPGVHIQMYLCMSARAEHVYLPLSGICTVVFLFFNALFHSPDAAASHTTVPCVCIAFQFVINSYIIGIHASVQLLHLVTFFVLLFSCL